MELTENVDPDRACHMEGVADHEADKRETLLETRLVELYVGMLLQFASW